MYPRFITQKLKEALTDTPVVIIAGPRQCGKTTLVKNLISPKWEYITFDNPSQLEIAKRDPIGFIYQLTSENTVLDEIQRIPELFVCIKQSVDELRKPGRFLLTGSANAMMLPQLSDSLAGRIEILSLLPLSEGEIRSKKPTFIEKLISQTPPTTTEVRIRNLLMDKVVAGGFPEPLSRNVEKRRASWYTQFLNSVIQRDLKEISAIEYLDHIPLLLKLLANQTGQITNMVEIASKCGLSQQTVLRYFSLLSQLYLVEKLPAWHHNENKRLIKAPKIHFVDTGLLCALRGLTKAKLQKAPEIFGRILESYVYCELKKQASWLDESIGFYHYRDKDQVEVDIVLETPDGQVIGIEVKAAATLHNKDFQGLIRLQETAGTDFCMGILLYDGDHTTAFGPNLFAVPIAALWN